jgi:F-type H+-transporting ATPase subunit epsilon
MATRSRNTLHVEVVTAERELYRGDATMVNAPGSEGQLGILPQHAALLTMLQPGAMRIQLDEAEEPLFVSGGFLEVNDDVVTVLADTAEYAEEIDEARAEEARRRAQERLEQSLSEQERAEVLTAVERAVARLRVAELAHRHGRRRIQMPPSEP